MRFLRTSLIVAMGSVVMWISDARGVDMEWVMVGDPGNAADTEVMVTDGTFGYGAVDYTFNMGKYEVTAGQYCEFLNAVAQTDPHRLYNADMWSYPRGCKIERTGSSGSYTYTVLEEWADRPVTSVSWYDAMRFANWLHNGQPVGPQDASSTENGAYDMSPGSNLVRKPGARVFLPNEDEWYKAAYYDPNKPGGPGYWDYPTRSDTVPTSEPPGGTNMTHGSANYYHDGYVDTTHWTTTVGAYSSKPSTSACGTYDQGGNVWEWNETRISTNRNIRGSSFCDMDYDMHANHRANESPQAEVTYIGFRVAAEVPEPSSLGLALFGGLALFRRRR